MASIRVAVMRAMQAAVHGTHERQLTSTDSMVEAVRSVRGAVSGLAHATLTTRVTMVTKHLMAALVTTTHATPASKYLGHTSRSSTVSLSL
jgi:hypothetical protein